VQDEVRACHERGMTPEEAMRAINLGRLAELDEHVRIAQNVLAVNDELDPTLAHVDTIEVFRRMAELEGFTE
jgi:cyclase